MYFIDYKFHSNYFKISISFGTEAQLFLYIMCSIVTNDLFLSLLSIFACQLSALLFSSENEMRWDEIDEIRLEWEDENNSFCFRRWILCTWKRDCSLLLFRTCPLPFQCRSTCILPVFLCKLMGKYLRIPLPLLEKLKLNKFIQWI